MESCAAAPAELCLEGEMGAIKMDHHHLNVIESCMILIIIMIQEMIIMQGEAQV